MSISLSAQGKRLVLYCLIGCTGAGLDFLLFALLTRWCGVHYLLANILSVSLGISNNFFLNRRFNFKVKDATLRRYILFFLTGMLGLAISTTLLRILVGAYGMNDMLAKFLTIFVVTLVQFVLNTLITFRRTTSNEEHAHEP